MVPEMLRGGGAFKDAHPAITPEHSCAARGPALRTFEDLRRPKRASRRSTCGFVCKPLPRFREKRLPSPGVTLRTAIEKIAQSGGRDNLLRSCCQRISCTPVVVLQPLRYPSIVDSRSKRGGRGRNFFSRCARRNGGQSLRPTPVIRHQQVHTLSLAGHRPRRTQRRPAAAFFRWGMQKNRHPCATAKIRTRSPGAYYRPPAPKSGRSGGWCWAARALLQQHSRTSLLGLANGQPAFNEPTRRFIVQAPEPWRSRHCRQA